MMTLAEGIRVGNGVATIIVGLIILSYSAKKESRSSFTLLWGVGFCLWGLSTVLRTSLPIASPQIIALFIAALVVFYLGALRVIKALGIFVAMGVTVALLVILGTTVGSSIVFLGGHMFWISMAAISVILRKRLGKTSNILLLGWIFTLALNTLLMLGFDPAAVDIMGIGAKIVIGIGVISPRFAYTAYIKGEKWLRETPKGVISPAEAYARSIDEAVGLLGEEFRKVFYHRIGETMKLTTDQFLHRPADLRMALGRVYGPGMQLLERMMVERIGTTTGMNFTGMNLVEVARRIHEQAG